MNHGDLHAWAARHGVGPVAVIELQKLLGIVGPIIPQTEVEPNASETHVQACVRLEVERWGGTTWRNNSGACVDATGRQVRYGLANDSAKLNAKFKSSDLIGIAPGGRFLAVECKPRGWRYMSTDRERAQLAFITRVNELGGIAGFATCVHDVARMVDGG